MRSIGVSMGAGRTGAKARSDGATNDRRAVAQSQTRRADDQHNLPALDGLRAISISLVLATHLLPLGPKALRLNEMTGPMGMSLFFVLSGFLIVRTLRTDSVAAFAVKRMARILPLAWLYLAAVAVLAGLHGRALLASLAFVLNYRTDLMIPLTEHFWSLGVETQFYAFIALLAMTHKKAIALVWPACLAITALRIHQGATVEIATHLRGDEILAGACLGAVGFARRTGGVSSIVWFALVGLLAAASHPESGWLQYLRPYASMALLAATLQLRPSRLLQALTSAPLRYVAAISYALYVVHPLTAQKGWWNTGSIAVRYLLKRPIGLALTFAVAHASTFYWERRWTRAARRWIARWPLEVTATSSAGVQPG